MCRKSIYLITVVLALGLARYAFAVDAEIPTASTAPVVDGIKEDAWSASKENKCLYAVSGDKPKSAADLSCNWWAMWDSDNFYVFVDVNDEDLQNDSAQSYEDDSVEIYVDIGNDKQDSYGGDDYQYRVAWNSEVPEIEEHYHSTRSLVGMEFIVRKTDANDGYTLEIKFPWSALLKDAKAAIGDLMGFTIMINDDDAGSGRDTQFSWQEGTADAWSNPSLFGTVKLVGGLSLIKASSPKPSNGAEGVLAELIQWTAGVNAKSHNVYFGTNPTPGDDEFRGNQTKTEYKYPAGLDPNTTYYWRVDEVNDASLWPGDVWSFTTVSLTGTQF